MYPGSKDQNVHANSLRVSSVGVFWAAARAGIRSSRRMGADRRQSVAVSTGAVLLVAQCLGAGAQVLTTQTTVVSTGKAGYSTYQVAVAFDRNARDVYALYGGAAGDRLVVPPAYHVAAPFGSNIGPVNPAFFAVAPDCQYDSFLTIGTDGPALVPGALSSVGLDFNSWSDRSGLTSSNGAVFFMDPDHGATSMPVVFAQLTVPTGTHFSGQISAQGRSTVGGDWDATSIVFSDTGGQAPAQAPGSGKGGQGGRGAQSSECSEGYYVASAGSCDMCDAGFADLDRSAATPCDPCFPGTYTSGGSVTCTECPPGTMDGDFDASTPCIMCEVGTYSSGRVTVCDDCHAGEADTDSDPSTPCMACSAGEYSPRRATSCTACEAGRADLDFDPTTMCELCDNGSYSHVGSTACPQCPHNTVDDDADPSTACVACVVGYVSPPGAVACTPMAPRAEPQPPQGAGH